LWVFFFFPPLSVVRLVVVFSDVCGCFPFCLCEFLRMSVASWVLAVFPVSVRRRDFPRFALGAQFCREGTRQNRRRVVLLCFSHAVACDAPGVVFWLLSPPLFLCAWRSERTPAPPHTKNEMRKRAQAKRRNKPQWKSVENWEKYERKK
jgi:hypothetical protein